MWNFDESEPVGHAFFKRHTTATVAYRRMWAHDTDATRLVTGETDGLPGLIADQYGTGDAGQLVCQFSAAGMEHRKQAIATAFAKETECPNVYERSDVSTHEREGLEQVTGVLAGTEPPADLSAIEYGMRYYVDVREGHETDSYVDQRDNRTLISVSVRGRDVLSCFCYTGGSSLVALKGETHPVVSIDSSGEILVMTERNVTLDSFDPACVEQLDTDVFKSLRNFRAEGRQFDLTVLNPPKLATSAQQVDRAVRAYKEINLTGMQLLRPSGLLFTYPCSGVIDVDLFQKIVVGAVADAKVMARIQRRLTGGVNHPLLTDFPEGEYLKGLPL